ncbi:glycosyltransferase family protein [Flavobacterium silvaticum]|uniref:Glycosyltransferase family 4 protein n=1 Tax=Flavobacterium silvaticum TaxID=1852020 RepID=A0A972FSD1_9FLAO|nr:glycosyltransferase [Flavobacterium silvaticum]NMH26660.1 glycosyltransferase family 4 protein [Flavobacterium silvaticum]
MRILLVGEYSRLHNSLKEGLIRLGHEVTLVSSGDGFKGYPSDYSFGNSFTQTNFGRISERVLRRLFGYDLNRFERGFRFKKILKNLKGYDVVQLINEATINTFPDLELKLLKQLSAQNKKMFLLCSGADYMTVSFLMKRTLPYSMLDPYFENPEKLKHQFEYVFNFLSSDHKKIHDYLYQNVNGVIATDLDYVYPLKGNPEFIGLIPNPVNLEKIDFKPIEIVGKVVIFLGINRHTYYAKGIPYFELALAEIKYAYADKVEIVVVENMPYADYIKAYDRAHILLDQVYSTDQGYNALEAMAAGKVVFTGGGSEFMEQFGLNERVVIDAAPNVETLVSELQKLIENPGEITAIGKRARSFVEKEHDLEQIALRYLGTWKSH